MVLAGVEWRIPGVLGSACLVKGRQGAFPGWISVTAGTEAGGAGLQHKTQMAR